MSKRRLKLKRLLGIFGISVAAIGWFISNPDRSTFVYKIICPKYTYATTALSRMHEKQFVLNKEDIGFVEISEILRESPIGSVEPLITQIKTLGWGQGISNTPTGIKMIPYIELELSFSNSAPVSGSFHDLEKKIEEKYLKVNLFIISATIFWFGIAISLVALFL